MVSAYGIAVKELDDPARTELQIALTEIRIGQPFERAMENLGERLPSRELSVLVSTLAIQQRSGGDLVRALSDMATTLEARRETQREVKTLMAGATASSYVVMVIGAAALFLADLTRPGTLDRVASSPLGAARAGRRAHPLRRRLPAHQADHEDRGMSGLYGLLAMAVYVVAILGFVMVRDKGLAWRFEEELGRRLARAREPREPCSSVASGPPARRWSGACSSTTPSAARRCASASTRRGARAG